MSDELSHLHCGAGGGPVLPGRTVTAQMDLLKGLWRENPVLIQLLGLCPTLAVTNSVANSVVMAGATFFVLAPEHELVHRIDSDDVRDYVRRAAAKKTAERAAAEEKTEYTVILKDVGPKKIDVIKAIRQITTLGLKDAKDLAETAGAKVLEQASKEAAQDAKSKLEGAGATVELA